MAPVGSQLPVPSLDKRKRDAHGRNSSSGSDSDIGPAPPTQTRELALKRPRMIGPSLPPPSTLGLEPNNRDEDTSSSDDDGFGPSLPPSGTGFSDPTTNTRAATNPEISNISNNTTKRDDWMLVPPSGGDWSARIDPTKLKNRKFNTGKGAKGPSSSMAAGTDSWHETPQEKQARLQREMMGIKEALPKSTSSNQPSVDKADAETAKKLQEYNKARGPTLYEAHQQNETEEKDDDPSARAFDREKDIGGGLQVNATQRRDMMRKAADFNSKFSSGKYL